MAEQKFKILVVDNEESIRDVMKLILDAPDLDIATVESGNKAAKMLNQQDFDMIICDVKMNDGDGFMLLDHVRIEQNSSIPFFLMSGHSADHFHLLESKTPDKYMMKPIDFSELKESIEACKQSLQKAS